MICAQVKKELKELRALFVVKRCGLNAPDPNKLFEKYKTAAEKLDPIDYAIFTEKIINNKTFYEIGQLLHYTEYGIQARWKKIISQFALICN